jgi:DDE superfamily endonuclease
MLKAVRDAHRKEVLAGLGQQDAVLAIDESGVVKQGTKSAGVARQYCGASGKIDNCQVGVFLSWQTAKGHALSRSGALPAAGMDRRPSRPRPVRSAFLGRLAPAHDAGHGGPGALGAHARPALRPANRPTSDPTAWAHHTE